MPQLLVLIDVLNYGCCQGQQKSQKKKKCTPVAKNGQTMKKIASYWSECAIILQKYINNLDIDIDSIPLLH